MPSPAIDESALTKGQLRKLNALRKSIGNDIGECAFSEWLEARTTAVAEFAAAHCTYTFRHLRDFRLRCRREKHPARASSRSGQIRGSSVTNLRSSSRKSVKSDGPL